MCKSSKAILRKIFASILFVALAMQLSGSYLYAHKHILDDGTVISHTHLFNRSSDSNPYKDHQHTDVDQVYADSLDFFGLTGNGAFLLQLMEQLFHAGDLIESLFSHITTLQLGRAPPILE